MEAPPVTVMPVTGGTINMMEYLLQDAQISLSSDLVAGKGVRIYVAKLTNQSPEHNFIKFDPRMVLQMTTFSAGPTLKRNNEQIGGSVLDQALDSLLHRLRGLCDNIEPESFADYELVYLLKGQQGNPFLLRARRSMMHPTAPWHLRYLGQPEVGDKSRHALVRNCVDVATSHSLPEFLNEMGFRLDHEFVAKGHIFRKGALKVVVSKLFRVLVPGNTENTEPLSLSYLVELSVLAPAGQDNVSEEMRNFAEQLKPLVHLEKIDPKRHM